MNLTAPVQVTCLLACFPVLPCRLASTPPGVLPGHHSWEQEPEAQHVPPRALRIARGRQEKEHPHRRWQVSEEDKCLPIP